MSHEQEAAIPVVATMDYSALTLVSSRHEYCPEIVSKSGKLTLILDREYTDYYGMTWLST